MPWGVDDEEEDSNSTVTDDDQERFPSDNFLVNQTASLQCGQPSDRYPTNLRIVDGQLLRETTVGSAFIPTRF